MNAQQAINLKFTELCTKLGSAMLQKLELDAKVESLRSEITALNSIVPAVLKIEADLQAKDTLEKSQKTGNGT